MKHFNVDVSLLTKEWKTVPKKYSGNFKKLYLHWRGRFVCLGHIRTLNFCDPPLELYMIQGTDQMLHHYWDYHTGISHLRKWPIYEWTTTDGRPYISKGKPGTKIYVYKGQPYLRNDDAES